MCSLADHTIDKEGGQLTPLPHSRNHKNIHHTLSNNTKVTTLQNLIEQNQMRLISQPSLRHFLKIETEMPEISTLLCKQPSRSAAHKSQQDIREIR